MPEAVNKNPLITRVRFPKFVLNVLSAEPVGAPSRFSTHVIGLIDAADERLCSMLGTVESADCTLGPAADDAAWVAAAA
jgi:hypothetical protein